MGRRLYDPFRVGENWGSILSGGGARLWRTSHRLLSSRPSACDPVPDFRSRSGTLFSACAAGSQHTIGVQPVTRVANAPPVVQLHKKSRPCLRKRGNNVIAALYATNPLYNEIVVRCIFRMWGRHERRKPPRARHPRVAGRMVARPALQPHARRQDQAVELLATLLVGVGSGIAKEIASWWLGDHPAGGELRNRRHPIPPPRATSILTPINRI